VSITEQTVVQALC